MISGAHRARIIPCLLMAEGRLVKTYRFGKRTYIGDPLNTLAIFNDKEVDEIVVLDIDASRRKRRPDFAKIEEMASQCFMPLAYGGGVRSVEDVQRIINLGVEKVILNSAAIENPVLIEQAASSTGSQSIVVSIDVSTSKSGLRVAKTHGGANAVSRPLEPIVKDCVDAGAGELLLQSINRDSTMKGYDLELIRFVTNQVSVPVIACGGAGSMEDLASAIVDGGASAAAAGSLFVYQGRHRAVLITYPKPGDVQALIAARSRGVA